MKKYLFTPGPAPVPPEVLLEMARPIIHHRTPEFSAALDQARDRMKPLYGTSGEVILLASTGTGAGPGVNKYFFICGIFDYSKCAADSRYVRNQTLK